MDIQPPLTAPGVPTVSLLVQDRRRSELLLSLIANNRRADFVALLVGLAVAWVLMFTARKRARKSLLVVLLVTAVCIGAYVAAFSTGTGGFSAPARAQVSVFRPDPTEAASNLL